MAEQRTKKAWDEVEFGDALGMSTNPNNPNLKTAKRLLNVHSHEKPGALVLRPGYLRKYGKPIHSYIINWDFPNFEFFLDKQADPEGQEIAVLSQKGTVTALEDGLVPIVEDTQNMLIFWVRPFWDSVGEEFNDNSWQWLNHTIITKIVDVNMTYRNVITVFGNSEHGLGEHSLDRYVIYNKTKDRYSRVIVTKASGENLRLNTTHHPANDYHFEVGDVLIISKYFIDLAAQEELFNVGREEYSYHTINHDLRVGFGGYENRPGLMVGYRKYFQNLEVEFVGPTHPDLTDEVLEAFAKEDDIILDTIIPNKEAYRISLSTAGGDTFEQGKYYFRLTGLIDNFQEVLLAERSITLDDPTMNITVAPVVILGLDSPRITKLILYRSPKDDNTAYFKIREDILRSTESGANNWTLYPNGELRGIVTGFSYHKDRNAANYDSLESNSNGSWSNATGGVSVLAPQSSYTFNNPDPPVTPDNGSYYLLFSNDEDVNRKVKIYSPILTGGDKKLTITISLISKSVLTKLRISSQGSPENYHDIDVDTYPAWKTETFDLIVDGIIIITYLTSSDNALLGIDSLKAVDADELLSAAEMSEIMGYIPSFNMVKGWDMAIPIRGRSYYLNPYIEKRYENYLLPSHIHSDGSYMYDLASFSSSRELERFDASDAVAMVMLPNHGLLILKKNTAEVVDPETGQASEPMVGVSCITKNAVVNANGVIFWAGREDIYMFSTQQGVIAKPLLSDTIRDLYLSIVDKVKLFGVRDRYNTYRLRIYDPLAITPDGTNRRAEFLLTENGWIEEMKCLFPEIYREDKDQVLNFLSCGNIFNVTQIENAGDICDCEEEVVNGDGSGSPIGGGSPGIGIVVTVSAPDNLASYPGNNGLFRISRSGDTFAELIVNVSISGTAIPDVDYTALLNSYTIPAGEASVDVDVTPLETLETSDFTVIMTVEVGTGYSVGEPDEATVNIDNEAAGTDCLEFPVGSDELFVYLHDLWNGTWIFDDDGQRQAKVKMTSEWTQVVLKFITGTAGPSSRFRDSNQSPGTTTEILVGFYGDGVTEPISLDDVEIVPITSAIDYHEYLSYTNLDFEDDLTDWTETDGLNEITVVTDSPHSGTKCLRTSGEYGVGKVSKAFTGLTEGAWYEVSFWARAAAPGNGVDAFLMLYSTGNAWSSNTFNAGSFTHLPLTTEWQQFKTYFRAHPGAGTPSFQIKSTGGLEAYFDDIAIRQACLETPVTYGEMPNNPKIFGEGDPGIFSVNNGSFEDFIDFFPSDSDNWDSNDLTVNPTGSIGDGNNKQLGWWYDELDEFGVWYGQAWYGWMAHDLNPATCKVVTGRDGVTAAVVMQKSGIYTPMITRPDNVNYNSGVGMVFNALSVYELRFWIKKG